MPPMTRGSVDIAGPSNPSPNPGNRPGTNPRPNPVCLDVPVVVRNLPAGNGTPHFPPAGPFEEHARTVIVFDNGAVLRVSAELPIGQEVIVSNSQGREAVCRLARTPSLPSIKGFVEIEFLESVSDFWGIQQPEPQTNVLIPPASASEPKPADAVSSAQTAESAVQESGATTGEAPSFDDIAGVVPMAPDPEQTKRPVSGRESSKTSISAEDRPRPEKLPEERRTDTAKPVAQADRKGPVTQAPAASKKDGVQRPSVSGKQNDILGKSLLAASSVSTPKKSRGNTVALLVLGILIVAGIAAAYLFLYRGGIAGLSGKATEAAPLPAIISQSASIYDSTLRPWKSVPALVDESRIGTSSDIALHL